MAFGYDIDPEAVRLTLENAKKAGVAQYISAEVRDIKDFSNDGPFGCVICNPPYGERLLDVKTAEDIYKTMGRVFTPKRGWSYAPSVRTSGLRHASAKKPTAAASSTTA